MAKDCLFCKIIKGEIPSQKVFENQRVLAFRDIQPLAKIHYLFIHKDHTADINELAQASTDQLSDIFKAIAEVTQKEKLDGLGFRVVTNQGKHAGQTVFHTHFHVLAGERLGTFGAQA